MTKEKINRRDLQNKYDFLKPTYIEDGLMAFGFECNDGWLNILADLFKKIDTILVDKERKVFRVIQVKEKFGELRVYCNFCNDKIDELVDEATIESRRTCEVCGSKNAKQYSDGWIVTLCKKCAIKRKRKSAVKSK